MFSLILDSQNRFLKNHGKSHLLHFMELTIMSVMKCEQFKIKKDLLTYT